MCVCIYVQLPLGEIVKTYEHSRRQMEEVLRYIKIKVELEDRVAAETFKAAKVPIEEVNTLQTCTRVWCAVLCCGVVWCSVV